MSKLNPHCDSIRKWDLCEGIRSGGWSPHKLVLYKISALVKVTPETSFAPSTM